MSEKLKPYWIAGDYDADDLEEQVREMMVEGWTPQGGVSVSVMVDVEGDSRYHFWQAMIWPVKKGSGNPSDSGEIPEQESSPSKQ